MAASASKSQFLGYYEFDISGPSKEVKVDDLRCRGLIPVDITASLCKSF